MLILMPPPDMPNKTPWYSYRLWLTKRRDWYHEAANLHWRLHMGARCIAGVGAIAAPLVMNTTALPRYLNLVHSLGTILSFLVAAVLVVDGIFRWNDSHASYMTAAVTFEVELNSYENQMGDYKTKNTQQERDDLLHERTAQLYKDQRLTRVQGYVKGAGTPENT